MARILTGTKIYARLIWSVAPGHEHSYKRVLVSLIDISQRRQIEEAYRLLVEHSPQGLAILDATGVVFANPALSSIVGYPPWRLPPLLPLRPAGLRCPSGSTFQPLKSARPSCR